MLRKLFPILLAFALVATSDLLSKPTWYKTRTEQFVAYGNARAKDFERVLNELEDGRRTLEYLMSDFVRADRVPIRVVICRGPGTIEAFGPTFEGKPVSVGGFFTKDFEGPIMVIRTDFDNEIIKHVIYHEYIHYLTRQTGLSDSLWLNEGIAELFATTRRRNADQVIAGEFLEHNLIQIQERGLIPFERFFAINHESPEYRSDRHGSGRFYAQSWAFLHYLMFGKNDLPAGADQIILKRAFENLPMDETFIQETLGLDFDALEKRLERYCSGGRFSRHIFALDERPVKIDAHLEEMSDGEVQLIHGALCLATRGPKEAYPYLARASASLPDNPSVLSYLAYHSIRQDLLDQAVEELKRALDSGAESPYSHLHYARLLLQKNLGKFAIRPDTLSRDLTLEILTHLFKARKLSGSFDEELYRCIGQTWLSSTVKPTDEHMEILYDGLRAFPRDDQIAMYLIYYYTINENFARAKSLLDIYASILSQTKHKAVYNAIKERLATQVSDEAKSLR